MKFQPGAGNTVGSDVLWDVRTVSGYQTETRKEGELTNLKCSN